MSTRLKTTVDSISILGGARQDRVHNMAAFERGSMIPTRHGRGNLYVLVETVGGFPDPAQIQQHLIQVAEERFRTDGSLTNALREAIKAANTYLFESNLSAPREERGIAGMTCLVLKDQDAYVGQAGPALLYHVARDTFQRLPEDSAWLSADRLQDVDISKNPPLGLRREIEPELSHLHSQGGDVFILASVTMVRLASDEQIRGAVIQRGPRSLRESLQALAAGRDLSLLVLELLEAEQAGAPAESVEEPGAGEKRPALLSKVASALHTLAGQREGPRPEEEFPVAAAETSFGLAGEEAEESMERAPGLDLRGTLQSIWDGARRVVRRVLPILSNVLPKAEPEGRRTSGAGARRVAKSTQSNRRWLWLVLAIPVIVIVLYAVTRYQYERSLQARLAQLVQTAEAAKAASQASPAIAEQRAKLREAIAALQEALLLRPADEAITTEIGSLQSTLDEKNYVSRLFYFGELQEFADVGDAKCQLSTVIVHGIDVYVLDVGTDRVYKYLLSSTKDTLQPQTDDAVILRKGDQQGNIIVDEILDIVWVDPGTGLDGAGLLIVDKKGHILLYDPITGIEVSTVPDSDVWRAPASTAAFFANLYVLDPPANAVLKYEPSATGYDAASSNYLKSDGGADVAAGVDLAIDVNVYVLKADGTILKFFQGAGAPFPLTNLDEPLSGACCIFASAAAGEEGDVYVADTGHQRILRFSKEGVFLRQYRGRDPVDMNSLRGLFVDQAEQRFYITNGNKLYWAKLP